MAGALVCAFAQGSAFESDDFIQLLDVMRVKLIGPLASELTHVLDLLSAHALASHRAGMSLGDPFDWVCLLARASDFGQNPREIEPVSVRATALLARLAVVARQLGPERLAAVARAVTRLHAVRQLHAIEVELLRSERTRQPDPIVLEWIERTW